ncbi:MAG: OsmC family protein [Paludibacteraceae bacterium]
MKHIINSEWKGGLAFEADINGHKIITDAPIDSDGQDLGPSPKKLLLAGLAGCTGMDVVSILKKMHINIEKCNITVEGDAREEHPKYYEKMHVIYEFTGKDLPMTKVEKAVRMSEETYCGVEALFRKAIEITSEIRIKES